MLFWAVAYNLQLTIQLVGCCISQHIAALPVLPKEIFRVDKLACALCCNQPCTFFNLLLPAVAVNATLCWPERLQLHRCGNPSGCCSLQTGCQQNVGGASSLFPFGVCTLKYQYQVKQDQATLSQPPQYWYRPADVANWPGWGGGAASQQCKGFTSGAFVSLFAGWPLWGQPS